MTPSSRFAVYKYKLAAIGFFLSSFLQTTQTLKITLIIQKKKVNNKMIKLLKLIVFGVFFLSIIRIRTVNGFDEDSYDLGFVEDKPATTTKLFGDDNDDDDDDDPIPVNGLKYTTKTRLPSTNITINPNTTVTSNTSKSITNSSNPMVILNSTLSDFTNGSNITDLIVGNSNILPETTKMPRLDVDETKAVDPTLPEVSIEMTYSRGEDATPFPTPFPMNYAAPKDDGNNGSKLSSWGMTKLVLFSFLICFFQFILV